MRTARKRLPVEEPRAAAVADPEDDPTTLAMHAIIEALRPFGVFDRRRILVAVELVLKAEDE